MAKTPIDPDALMKAIADAMKSAGMSASQGQIKSAIGGVTKSVGRRAPRTPAKGAAAAKPARTVPKITPQTATGGRGGKKPPKPPTASAAAPKGPKKRDPLGSDADVNKYIMREGRTASQYRKQGGEVSREEAIMADIYEKERLSNRKPKPPASGSPARKPSPKPKKPSGGVKKMTRAQKREINVAKHWADRSKYLAESSAKSRAAKEETRAANRAAWAKRQDEMEAKRLAGRKKMKKKKDGE
jgi:hypothetical protein